MNNIASITDTEKFPAGVDLPCFRPRSAKKALSLINQQMGTIALNHLINHRFRLDTKIVDPETVSYTHLLQIPVGHVEAGLRTYNIYSPYPLSLIHI